jgi:hypothetical protein
MHLVKDGYAIPVTNTTRRLHPNPDHDKLRLEFARVERLKVGVSESLRI